MRTTVLAVFLALAGCSGQEAGRSPYIQQPFQATPEQQALVAANQAEADRILAANLAQQDDRRRFAVNAPGAPDSIFVGGTGLDVAPPLATGTDDTLVASLEAAIESAGAPEVAAAPLAGDAGVQTGLAASSVAIPAPGAPAAAVTLRETDLTVAASEAPAGQDGAVTRITDNSFTTVTQRETIESDAERLAALSQERVVLEAEPLPSATTSANLAAFARATQHRIGQRVYPRGRSSRDTAKAARTCRSYGNPDEAQRAFLAAGGPEADKLNLDPDGDGFVCGWSPQPYRSLTVGGN